MGSPQDALAFLVLKIFNVTDVEDHDVFSSFTQTSGLKTHRLPLLPLLSDDILPTFYSSFSLLLLFQALRLSVSYSSHILQLHPAPRTSFGRKG